jgi:hypothetical protein
VEGSAPSEKEEEIMHGLGAWNVEALAIQDSSAPTDRKEKEEWMMATNLDWLQTFSESYHPREAEAVGEKSLQKRRSNLQEGEISQAETSEKKERWHNKLLGTSSHYLN